MRHPAQVVVTCTKRKTVSSPQELMLRAVRRGSVAARSAAWIERLERANAPALAARDLYSGDHWSIVRSLAPERRARAARHIWICSAGYGLVNIDAALKPYSATFSRRHPDSIYRNCTTPSEPEIASQWWNALADWKGPVAAAPRTFADLAAAAPRSPLVIVASENYLKPIAADLRQAKAALARPHLLSIVSAGGRRVEGLAENFLPFDARLQAIVGGARRSVNVRVAQRLLEDCGQDAPTLEKLTALTRQLLEGCPDLPRYNRQPLSDDQVTAIVFDKLRRDPEIRPTPLLRQLRDSGRACEYSRFMRLFRSVEADIRGR